MNRDGVFGKSDPHLQLWETRGFGGSKVRMIGKTEVVKNNQNPVWSTSMEYMFIFEAQQFLKVIIVDSDDGQSDDNLGEADLELVNIITKGAAGLDLDLKFKGANKGRVKISFQKTAAESSLFTIAPLIAELNGGCCSNNDVFIKIFRPLDAYITSTVATQIPSNGWSMIHETEHYINQKSPKFSPFDITGARLCKNNNSSILKFELFDFRNDGFHVSLGAGYASVQDLLNGKGSVQTNGGKVSFTQFSSIKILSIIELIQQGMQMSLYVAIDFTGSNGVATSPSSLHYMNPNLSLNGYENAITSVGNILQEYDSKKIFPVFGFGATAPKMGINDVSHCFPLSGNMQNPSVMGVSGILGAYRQCLPSLTFSGPTNFTPIITECIKSVRFATQQGVFAYSTLLILTDGAITDLDDTIEAIIDASSLPLSIIIIGVGSADFSSMDALDSDGRLLKSRRNATKVAVRDIVQFVAMKDFQGNH